MSEPETRELHQRLTALEERVRTNERIWRGFRDVETRLVAARSPAQWVQTLEEAIPAGFPAIDRVTVALADTNHEYRRLARAYESSVILVSTDWLQDCLGSPAAARLGRPEPPVVEILFAHGVAVISAALVPLVLRGHLIGSLNLASSAPGHFDPDQQPDLLNHLAVVAALCIDNVLNRERLRQDGITDPLTGIANRRFFERRLREEVLRSRRCRGPLACLLVDLDHFKQINDHHGHQAGDEVLQRVARALATGLRGHDVLARFGGEEFVLLLPDTTLAAARDIAERLRLRVKELRFGAREDIFGITLSAGLADLGPQDGAESVSEVALDLVKRADAALYAAKHGGRDQLQQNDYRAGIAVSS